MLLVLVVMVRILLPRSILLLMVMILIRMLLMLVLLRGLLLSHSSSAATARATYVVVWKDGRLELGMDFDVKQPRHDLGHALRTVLVVCQERERQVASLSPSSLAQQGMVGLGDVCFHSDRSHSSLKTQLNKQQQ